MVLVFTSMMVAYLGDQVLKFNLWVIGSLLVATGLALVVFNWTFVRRFYYTFFRDMRAAKALFQARLFMFRHRNSNVPTIFSELAAREGSRTAFHYKDEKWSFRQIESFSNKIGNTFEKLGYKPGDEVALLMHSRPEYVGVWLGMAKNGVVTAFINTNQRMETLVHSVTVVNCKAVIFDTALTKNLYEAAAMIAKKKPDMKYYSYTGVDPTAVKASADPEVQAQIQSLGAERLEDVMKGASEAIPRNMHTRKLGDKLYYIFTSGTTGLPKAAIIRHHRYIYIGMILHYLFNIDRKDTLYLSLPLYHNNAGTIGTCQGVIFGTSIVLKEKFSASQFWDDCIKYNCTVAMYIGELCRYLLAQPKKTVDQQHKVRLMFGNGLRQEIWRDFKTRFNIKQIGEVYGSTEGNANVANYDFKEGACGIIPCCVPFICRLVFPIIVIKVDPQTGEHIRGPNGLCVLAKAGEIGEIVGKIRDDGFQSYPGYVNTEATKKKVIYNVFRNGDSAFLSGDLVEIDEFGYLYFRDRTGDTFRWKGENVSTNEVEAVVQKVVKLSDCVVFGVSIPNCDGKAGMAVIADPDNTIEFGSLYKELSQRLPVYAVPQFIRITHKIELTGSFKLSKFTLEKDGYKLEKVKDPIYFLDRKQKTYVPLDETLYEDIKNGRLII